MSFKDLQATLEPLFKNLPSTGPDAVRQNFVDAYAKVTADFPHTNASEEEQIAIGEIMKKSAQFLTRDQIGELHTRVHLNLDKIPTKAMVGYLTTMSGTISALTPAQRSALPPLKELPGQGHPLAVTRYKWHLDNRK